MNGKGCSMLDSISHKLRVVAAVNACAGFVACTLTGRYALMFAFAVLAVVNVARIARETS